jgi:predicted RND superfamily exporter protein
VFLITHLLRFSVRHPRVVITLVGTITLCALVFIPRIQLRLDHGSLIPSNLPQFAEGDQVAVSVGPPGLQNLIWASA